PKPQTTEKPGIDGKEDKTEKEDGGKEKPGEDKKPDDNVEVLTEDVKFSPGVKGKKIVIDAGHGGEDSGAIGPSGVTEKSITLQIAKEVERMLKEAGAKVIMTRSTDTEVSPKHRQATDVDELQARCDVANKAKADIFISIHMDSFTSREASGTTGYYYTKGSASSKRLAAAIQSELVSQLKTTSRGIKTCNFYVVKHTKMPATLIEVAFVSNPKEEKLLTSKKGVQKAAIGIVNGISDFFGE
ncbi:MAG: N-acetylmuramoyl-L-alanine amidase, partial [Schwartzia sp.]|nr:N-acetylmuramoyl-L-alanine amidase [Schwartzia sp. (in: firmicutes)]